MSTLYLDPETWDLAVDARGAIAIATQPYQTAQSVANACRLWRGEAPFNTDRGIPYDTEILGQLPPARQLAGWYEDEARTVPNVASAIANIDYANRTLSGQIQCTLTDGTVINV